MAKDLTLRGGQRINQTGRPRKSLSSKVKSGNPGHRKLKVLDVNDPLEPAEIEGVDMPNIKEYLFEVQRDGKPFIAGEIYKETYKWLELTGCETLVQPHLLEQYSVSLARWIQCSEMITKYGVIAKHPTTGAPIQSPYVNVANQFMKAANLMWMQIYQVVKENSTVDLRSSDPRDDMMEKLLNGTWHKEYGKK